MMNLKEVKDVKHSMSLIERNKKLINNDRVYYVDDYSFIEINMENQDRKKYAKKVKGYWLLNIR